MYFCFNRDFPKPLHILGKRTCIKCSVSGWLSGASGPSLPPDFGSLVTSLFDAAPAGWRVKPHQLAPRRRRPRSPARGRAPTNRFLHRKLCLLFFTYFLRPAFNARPLSRDCEKSRMQHLRSRLLREQKGSESALLPSLLRSEDVVEMRRQCPNY